MIAFRDTLFRLILPLVLLTLWQDGPDSWKSPRQTTEAKMSESAAGQKKMIVPAGRWGAAHIRLIVTKDGAQINYDCAHGTIDTPMVTDRRGTFSLRGTHVKEHAGAIQLGETPDSHPARYTGRIDGQKMTLTVKLTDTDEEVGTFTLIRGGAGRIWKCF